MLLCPANLQGCKWCVFFRRGRDHTPVLIHNQDTRSAGSYVNPKCVDEPSPALTLCFRAGRAFCCQLTNMRRINIVYVNGNPI